MTPTGGIRIEGLRKRYGSGDTAVDALKGVNMEVAPGEVVGLIGPSGIGQEHRCCGAWPGCTSTGTAASRSAAGRWATGSTASAAA